MRFFAASFAAIVFIALPAWAGGAPIISNFTLKNGLEVIVVENHRVPAVSHTLWYRVGAADDPEGKSGLAHYHEHAMFLGTKKYKSGEYSKIITASGGEQNAFTGRDATAYYINIAKDKLPLAMEMEADRLRGLVLDDKEMEKEKQVIIEERRMRIDNHPEAQLAEQVEAMLFRNHPYHQPVIGWKHEMEELTKQDVINFHKKYYHPNNAVLIVAGDVTAQEVKPLAEKYYGGFASAKLPARVWKTEPPQNVARQVSMHSPQVAQAKWSRVYATVSLGEGKGDGKGDEVLPLYIAGHLLGGGKTSKLYRTLVVERKIATSVDVDYSGFNKGFGEFSIDIVPTQGAEIAEIEKAVDAEIKRIASGEIEDSELARAKTLLKSEIIFARDGLSSLANLIGTLRMIGQTTDYFTTLDKQIDAVSKTAVVAAIANNLKSEASVTAILQPEKAEDKK